MSAFRIEPALPAGAYDTYAIRMPKSTHQRPATCEEAECEAWRHGWVTRVPFGSAAADYITSGQSGRHFQETTGHANIAAGEQEFMFAPGQKCFASDQHTVLLDREPVFLKKRGDYRSSDAPRVLEPAQWVDEFAGNQERLSKIIEKG